MDTSTPTEVLLVTAGPGAGAEIGVGDEIELGRGADGALPDDPEVSRRHARITRNERGELVIEDLDSTNGTFVNADRITAPTVLAAGDRITLGDTTLELRRREPSEAAAEHEAESAAPRADPPAPVEQRGSPSALQPLPAAAGRTAASVLHAGRRIPVPPEGLAIGRQDDNDLVVTTDLASRHHARILPAEGRHYVADLDSTNGTFLNGERLAHESRWLNSGDTIGIGGETIRFLAGTETRLGVVPELAATTVVRFDGRLLTIGRDEANGLTLDAPNISRFHAEIVGSETGVEVRDLGSRNGTRVNGRLVTRAPIETGDEIGIGPYRLVFDGEQFVQRDDRGALRLHASELAVEVKGRRILNRVSLNVQPGELVAVIGESGSGKTTLVKALAGVADPTSGTVTVNGDPVESRLTDIGYVPQEDIVHRLLTVSESLHYSARLRLPQDSSLAEIEEAVRRVVDDVSLADRVETRIDALSGGQRKRVGLATELLNRPGLLFLDEPTTGLDPGLETRMMELFRELAEVGTRAVIVVTHATRNLDLADKLAVLGRGGELCFFGRPDEARRFFGVDTYDAIYEALLDRPAAEWRGDFERHRPAAEPAPPPHGVPAGAGSAPRRPAARAVDQAKVLASRYLRLLSRDRRNVLILLLQPPILAVVIAVLFKHAFEPFPDAKDAPQLVFLLVTTIIWLGTLDAARELIKERPVFARETAIGVRLPAYVASKAATLFGLVALQTLVLGVLLLIIVPLHEPAGTYLLFVITLVLTGFVAVAMGLAISAFVRTQDQATALIPIAMVVQLLFAGALVKVKDMDGLAWFSSLVFSRWSFAGLGGIIHMNRRLLDHNHFGLSFFSHGPLVAWPILLLFLAAMLGTAGALLWRQTR